VRGRSVWDVLEQEDPIELVRKTIELYLSKKCRDILDYISITGQKRIRISLYALFILYQSTEQYPRFMDALEEALKRSPDLLDSIGFKIERDENEEFFMINRENIEELCRKHVAGGGEDVGAALDNLGDFRALFPVFSFLTSSLWLLLNSRNYKGEIACERLFALWLIRSWQPEYAMTYIC